MRAFLVVSVALLAAAVIYCVPVAIRLEMLRWRLDPWILRVVVSELPACALLFGLGFRWSAPLAYCILAAVEGLALSFRPGPEKELVFLLNLLPAALSAVAAARIALRSVVEREEGL